MELFELNDPDSYAAWEKQLISLTNDVSSFFCWKRKKKKEKLGDLIRVGSQYLEHAGNRIAVSRDRLLNVVLLATHAHNRI